MSYNKVNQTTGDLEQIAGSQVNSVYSDAPLGVIMPYGGTTVPTAWLECDGSAVSRTTYADLFAVLGTKFGPGDGSTTFNLPSGDFGAQLYPAFEGMYIIKAVKTALPTDFQEALEVKQNITDNTLQTTSKTVPGAINEINSNLTSDTVVASVATDNIKTERELLNALYSAAVATGIDLSKARFRRDDGTTKRYSYLEAKTPTKLIFSSEIHANAEKQDYSYQFLMQSSGSLSSICYITYTTGYDQAVTGTWLDNTSNVPPTGATWSIVI